LLNLFWHKETLM